MAPPYVYTLKDRAFQGYYSLDFVNKISREEFEESFKELNDMVVLNTPSTSIISILFLALIIGFFSAVTAVPISLTAIFNPPFRIPALVLAISGVSFLGPYFYYAKKSRAKLEFAIQSTIGELNRKYCDRRVTWRNFSTQKTSGKTTVTVYHVEIILEIEQPSMDLQPPRVSAPKGDEKSQLLQFAKIY